ncbi:hypothetical protein [Erythrobacter sp. SD-21]|uniref:hypothetical protein n=1 Tax=Erythrobacter sp. SD-21 TaxID=161528 RepID=UPI000153F5CE|nr:hypothetical protein [Erythrobacter sp. SD-21]EDL48394.1 hypothetical protein ED21_22798 [Erythrobacter sp. SD-21]
MSEAGDRPGDGIVRWFGRHQRVLGVAGLVWLALSSAVYARFISLPDIPFLTDEIALYASAAYNAIWWGFLKPALLRRSSQLRGDGVET